LAISTGRDRSLRLWDLTRGDEVYYASFKPRDVLSAHFCGADAAYIIVVSRDLLTLHSVRSVDVRDVLAEVATPPGAALISTVCCLGEHVLVGYADGTVEVRAVPTLTPTTKSASGAGEEAGATAPVNPPSLPLLSSARLFDSRIKCSAPLPPLMDAIGAEGVSGPLLVAVAAADGTAAVLQVAEAGDDIKVAAKTVLLGERPTAVSGGFLDL
jgi:hypothetical protein